MLSARNDVRPPRTSAGPETEGLDGTAEGKGPWAAEIERLRQLVHDLRNPVGSVGLAVEMLERGLKPLLAEAAPDVRNRVDAMLEALLESARQLRHLVQGVDEPPAPPPVARAPELRVVAGPRRRRPAAEVAVDGLLRRLEVMTVTRSSLPALLSVEAEPGLVVRAHGSELLRGLSNLVENAIEASARAQPGQGPWTVEVRAFADGESVLLEVRDRGDGPPTSVLTWLSRAAGEGETVETRKVDGGLHGIGLRVARRVAEEVGGRLQALRTAGTTTMRLSLPRVIPPVEDAV